MTHDFISVHISPQQVKCNILRNIMKDFGTIQLYLANTYVFNVSNRNTRKRCDICSKLTIKKGIKKHMSMKLFLFFYQDFLSRAQTIHRTAGEGRGPSFILLYHFHPLMNIQTFICNFASEMTITYFQSQCLHLPDGYSMRFTTEL